MGFTKPLTSWMSNNCLISILVVTHKVKLQHTLHKHTYQLLSNFLTHSQRLQKTLHVHKCPLPHNVESFENNHLKIFLKTITLKKNTFFEQISQIQYTLGYGLTSWLPNELFNSTFSSVIAFKKPFVLQNVSNQGVFLFA